MATLRILHTADSHIGADLPARPRHARRRRGDDLIDSYRRVLRAALERPCDLVIHAGDLFDMPDPSGAAVAAAAEPLLELAAADIPVVIVPGNHERSAIPATLLLAHRNIHIARVPTTYTFACRGVRVCAAALPCIRRGAAKRFDEALNAAGWARQGGDVNILALHQTFESATCGPANYRFRSGEDVIERDAVPRGFDYVAAGHVHRHQVLRRGPGVDPPIVYAGSPDRVSFAEASEPKGFVEVEFGPDGLRYRFVEHRVRPMWMLPLDVSGLRRAQIVDAALERIEALPAETVALLRLSGQSTPREMRGLDLARRARDRRPDLTLKISSQAVEFVPERVNGHATTSRARSAFAELDAPPQRPHVATRDTPDLLPAIQGVYALHAADGRVLYVGKARNVRSRVRTHLRGNAQSGFFNGWTADIRRISVRRTYSELETLLIECDLIRRLQPPFNRQMRLWPRYVYLHQVEPYGRLEVERDRLPGAKCFGPYRSRFQAEHVRELVAPLMRTALCPPAASGATGGLSASAVRPPRYRQAALCERFFDGRCAGPCGERVPPAGYARLLERRNAFLLGVCDDAPGTLEAGIASECKSDDPTKRAARQRVEQLRAAFDWAATLREAEVLVDGLLVLPGPKSGVRTVLLAAGGVRLRDLSSAGDAACVLDECDGAAGSRNRLSKEIVDSLTTVVRTLRRVREPHLLIRPDELPAWSPQRLWAQAKRAATNRRGPRISRSSVESA